MDRTEELFPQMAQMRIKGLTQRRKGAKNSERREQEETEVTENW
jgi:hypothetical protein